MRIEYPYFTHSGGDTFHWSLRGLGLGAAPSPFTRSNYTYGELAQIYRETVGAGTMSEAEIVGHAIAAGIPDCALIEARNILLTRAQGTNWDGSPSGTTDLCAPVAVAPPPAPPPAVVLPDQLPPNWSRTDVATFPSPVSRPSVVSTIREVEAGAGGIFPTLPPVPMPADFGVGEMPARNAAIPGVLLAAAAAAAVFFLARR